MFLCPTCSTASSCRCRLFAAAGILGGLMRDLAPNQEDIWYFSPFVDLNLYRLFRQVLSGSAGRPFNARVIERAAFNVACNALVILAEFLRWGIHPLFSRHGTFFLFDGLRLTTWTFAASAATTSIRSLPASSHLEQFPHGETARSPACSPH